MGIKGLLPFLQKRWPHVLRPVEMREQLSGMADSEYAFAVDVPIFLCQAFYGGTYGSSDAPASQEPEDVINRFVKRFALVGGRSLFVFDGPSRPEKRAECIERNEQQQRAAFEASQLVTQADATERAHDNSGVRDDFIAIQVQEMREKAVKIARRSAHPDRAMYDQLRLKMNEIGWAHETARHDAEERIAQLAASGRAGTAMTDDTDVLVFGSPSALIRVGSGKMLCRVELQAVLAAMELTMAQFTDFCVLCGCDFTCTLEQVGPVGAYKGIQEHGSIEAMLGHLPERKRKRADDGEFDWVTARRVFSGAS